MDDLLASPAVWAALSAVISAWLAFVGGAYKSRLDHQRELAALEAKRPDPLAVASDAVAQIVQHYREALNTASTEIAALRAEIAAMRGTIEDLESHVDDLTTAMEKAGVAPPPRRKRIVGGVE